jgi:macrolide transport system ATP-binding/permease protein
MITLKNLSKSYGSNTILEGVSYTFPQNGLICLMGASGGGKTTLLNLIAGFDSDYQGEIAAGGFPLNKMDPDALCEYRQTHIGFVFQNYHLLTGYSALENVLLAAELSPENEAESSAKATGLLRQLGLGDKLGQSCETLSGGQKQRVAIARALMTNPRLILADEPTGALDRTTSTEIMTLLKEISKEKLVVVITHDEKRKSTAPAPRFQKLQGSFKTVSGSNSRHFHRCSCIFVLPFIR